MSIAVFILAGGSGIRLWPLSKNREPKQFLPLLPDGDTFYRKTLVRAKALTDISHIFILTQKNYKKYIEKLSPEIPEENIFTESAKKNTAPSIALAVMKAHKRLGCINCVIMPSDHYISDDGLFCKTIAEALSCAEKTNSTVTVGISPTRPATCYGYIEYPIKKSAHDYIRADSFTEKPDFNTATEFITKGNYLWNSGIYICKSEIILSAFKEFQPEIYLLAEKICNSDEESSKRIYSMMPSVSIDYGIIEHLKNIYVIPAEFGWDDIGSWYALERLFKPDEDNNKAIGNTLISDTKNSCVISRDSLTVLLGANDLYVINTGDAVLIFPKEKADSTPKLIALLEENGLTNLL